MTTHGLKDMTLSELANMIAKDWYDINIRAELCLAAMNELSSIKDTYCDDKGDMVVIRFLLNAVSWRGSLASMVKRELNRRLTQR